MMQGSRNHDSLTRGLCTQSLDVLLRLGDVLRTTSDLHTSLATSLAWHIESDAKPFFKFLANTSVWPNQLTVLTDRYIDRLSELVVSLVDETLNRSEDFLDNIGGTFDGEVVGFFTLTREANVFSAGTGAACFGNNALDVGTWKS